MPEKRIILITGANGGVGSATTEALLSSTGGNRQSYTVLYAARSLQRAKDAAEALKQKSESTSHGQDSDSDIVPVEVDIDDDNSIERLVKQVQTDYGRLDILVNNAASHLDFPRMKGEYTFREAVRRQCNTNMASTTLFTEAFLPLLLKSKEPRIIFISTGIASLHDHADTKLPVNKPWEKGWPKTPGLDCRTYRASKAGLNMLILELAKMLREDNIKIHILDPGLLATTLGGADPVYLRKIGAQEPIVGGRFIVSVIEGEHDQHTEVLLGKDGVIPW